MKLRNQNSDTKKNFKKIILQTQNQLDGDVEVNTDHHIELTLNTVITTLWIEVLGNLKCPRTNYTFGRFLQRQQFKMPS